MSRSASKLSRDVKKITRIFFLAFKKGDLESRLRQQQRKKKQFSGRVEEFFQIYQNSLVNLQNTSELDGRIDIVILVTN